MRYKKTIIFVICSLFLFTSTFGCISGPAAGDPPPYTPNTDYQSDLPFKPVDEMFHGFNIVSSDSSALVYDNITKKTVTFDSLVERQLDIFVEDLLTRLNAVYGYGLEEIAGKDFRANQILVLEDGVFTFRSALVESSDEENFELDEHYKAMIDKRDLVQQAIRTGGNSFVYEGETGDDNGNIYNIADYAKNLTTGAWERQSFLAGNLNLKNAIQGGLYYGAGGFSTILKDASLELQILKNGAEVEGVKLTVTGPTTQANLKDYISGFAENDVLSVNINGIENAGKFGATIDKVITSADLSGADIIYTLNNPIYNYQDFAWNSTQDAIATKDEELKHSMKLALARILATGDYNSTLSLSECIAAIDHLGILAAESEYPAEREKILEYIYKEIIGDKATQKDDDILLDLKTSLGESGLITSSSVIKNLEHYYKAYKLLIPAIVDCATRNSFEEVGTGVINDSEWEVSEYLSDYPLYPKLPRVKNSNIKFSDLYTEGGEVSDIFWMPEYERIKNVTFMAKEDVPIIELWTAFETVYIDDDGESRMDVTVDLQITFTYVVGGEKLLDNVRGYSGVGQSDTVTVTAGVYDIHDNDNSADFNIVDLLDAEHRKKLMGAYDGKTPESLSLYGSPYLVYANDSGVGSTVVIDSGNNYLQMSITVLSAYIVGERENVEMDRDNVHVRLGIFDPWY